MRTLNPYCIAMLIFSAQFYLLSYFHLVLMDFIAPNLPRKKFVKNGDFNLGVLSSLSSVIDDKQMCDGRLYSEREIHLAQVIEYAVENVNKRHLLPSNTTLGFVLLDDCHSEGQSVTQSLSFVPQTDCKTPLNSTNTAAFYDVVGVIGPSRSSQAIHVARLLSEVQIPVVSVTATSDELSKKTLYPFFLRTATPDRFQIQGLFSFIKRHNWTYVSLVYEAGSHGEGLYSALRELFTKHDICFAVERKVSKLPQDSEVREVAEELWQHQNARVVILLAVKFIAYKIIKMTGEVDNGTFIWVGFHEWAEEANAYMASLGKLLWGALVVTDIFSPVPEYENYFQALKPHNGTENPWLADFWEKGFNCFEIKNGCNTNMALKSNCSYRFSGRLIDVVEIYASAIARALNRSNCSSRGCLTGRQVKNELFHTNFSGKTGNIRFNEKGDMLGKYQIRQLLPATEDQKCAGLTYGEVLVAEYNAENNVLQYEKNLTWRYHWLSPGNIAPTSQCSEPCQAGEVILSKAKTCCWDCLSCMHNEYLSHNRTSCQSCPLYTWPDNETGRTTCKDLNWETPKRNLEGTAIGAFFIIVCLSFTVIYYNYRHYSLIKTSAQLLSYQMLFALTLGYVTIILLHQTPSEHLCLIIYWCFCLSFSLLYGPLLVRTLCIYRIFESARRSIQRPKLVRRSDQNLLTTVFALIQVSLCLLETIMKSKWEKLTMKSLSEPLVELSCDLEGTGITTFLAYNLLLLAMCSYLAFKTRNLPDNFNESRYISLCVSSTLLIWITFIPSYAVASREFIKTLLISLALGLNNSLALLFLFLPRIRAVLSNDTSETPRRIMLSTGAALYATRGQPSTTYVPRFQLQTDLDSKPLDITTVKTRESIITMEDSSGEIILPDPPEKYLGPSTMSEVDIAEAQAEEDKSVTQNDTNIGDDYLSQTGMESSGGHIYRETVSE